MLDTGLCSDYHILEGIRIAKFCLTVLKIVIPILLVVMGSIDFVKTVVTPDKRALKDQAIIFGKRVASAAVIFLVPTVIATAFSVVADAGDYFETISACFERADKEFIAELKASRREYLKNKAKKDEIVYETTYDNTLFLQVHDSSSSGASSGTATFSGELISDTNSFINAFEGTTGYCDSAQTQYKAKDIGDGTITVGPGVTSHIMSGLVDGQCYSVSEVDAKKNEDVNSILAQVESVINSVNPSGWDDAKTVAAVSIAYNCGTSYGKKVVEQYAASGNDGALAAFNSCVHASNGNQAFTEGLKKRRDIEYEVFLNGNLNTVNQRDGWSRKYIQ